MVISNEIDIVKRINDIIDTFKSRFMSNINVIYLHKETFIYLYDKASNYFGIPRTFSNINNASYFHYRGIIFRIHDQLPKYQVEIMAHNLLSVYQIFNLVSRKEILQEILK